MKVIQIWALYVKGGYKMPIYKVGNTKKKGLQKYHVRINYINDNGQKKQITRVAYRIDVASSLYLWYW